MVMLQDERDIEDQFGHGHRRLAEQEAKARHTTLTEVVAHQLRVMAQNWQDSRAGMTPVTDSLRGAVKLPPDF